MGVSLLVFCQPDEFTSLRGLLRFLGRSVGTVVTEPGLLWLLQAPSDPPGMARVGPVPAGSPTPLTPAPCPTLLRPAPRWPLAAALTLQHRSTAVVRLALTRVESACGGVAMRPRMPPEPQARKLMFSCISVATTDCHLFLFFFPPSKKSPLH